MSGVVDESDPGAHRAGLRGGRWRLGLSAHRAERSGLGNAYAGQAAVSNASTIYYNPAGMTQLQEREFSLGVDFLKTWKIPPPSPPFITPFILLYKFQRTIRLQNRNTTPINPTPLSFNIQHKTYNIIHHHLLSTSKSH